jgi:ferredoxin-NADP reductase
MAVSRPVAGGTGAAHDHAFHPLRVARVIRETADANSYVLELPDDLRPAFAYEAGQFCTFRVRVDGQPHLRCYSMSSSPAVDRDMVVTVKRTPGGVVSNFVHDHLGAGDVVEVTRPAGVFRLTASDEDVVAFSAGSGITPVHSLLKTALSSTARQVRLFYANRDHDSIIFRAELDALGAQHGDRLTVTHHLDAERGLVQPDAVRDVASVNWGSEFYVCGPGPFMDIVEEALLSGGVAPEQIHIERFTPTELVPEPVPSTSPGGSRPPSTARAPRSCRRRARWGWPRPSPASPAAVPPAWPDWWRGPSTCS